jgi:hypothetical protein
MEGELHWYDSIKNIEPYTVGHIIKYNGTEYNSLIAFHVYYRNYSRRQSTVIWAKDELSAFIEGTQHLQNIKVKWHRQNKGANP